MLYVGGGHRPENRPLIFRKEREHYHLIYAMTSME